MMSHPALEDCRVLLEQAVLSSLAQQSVANRDRVPMNLAGWR
jgi:hypothetical protein